MEFLIAVTDDKFHQVISAKGNASKLVTILSNNSGQVGQGQRCQNSIPLSGSKTLDWDFDSTSAFGCVWHKQWRRKDDLCKVLKSLMIKNSMDFDVDFPFCSIVFF